MQKMESECVESGEKHCILLAQVECAFCKEIYNDTLYDKCLRYIANNWELIFYQNQTGNLSLRNGLFLPQEVSEELLNYIISRGHYLSRCTMNIFRDINATRVKRVIIPASDINNENLEMLLRHELVELDISNCYELTDELCTSLNALCGKSLESLSIGKCDTQLRNSIISCYRENYLNNFGFGKLLKLTRLAIHNTRYPHMDALIRPLTNLVCLDLTNAFFQPNRLDFLGELRNLESLNLHNFKYVEYALGNICRLRRLRHLDISLTEVSREDGRNAYQKPTLTLAALVNNLVNLVSLDISCTNLAGTGVAQYEFLGNTSCDIPGLNRRMNSPLEFLGLYKTQHAACKRFHIPAKLITGDANEDQILIAAFRYINRVEYLRQILNDMYELLRYSIFHNIGQALTIILKVMEIHPTEIRIQISSSATLYYIVKSREKLNKPILCSTKKRIIRNIITGMVRFSDDKGIMRNGLLNLCQFKIPLDMIFEFQRLISILVDAILAFEYDNFIQRIGIFLLNSFACQVDGDQKLKLGELGVVKKMIAVISRKLSSGVYDDVLEAAWSTMWNVTDETAANCESFLNNDGLDIFMRCLQTYPEKHELTKNIMGLMGNVAEVQSLRSELIKPKLIQIFMDLLTPDVDGGIEVSYNAAGVLAHIASDGEEAWTISTPSRDQVLHRMTVAILSWNVSSQRNINYRSFAPILELTTARHTMECQLWAVWAMANLTTVYPEKYCDVIVKEDGLRYLEDMLLYEYELPNFLVSLTKMVIQNCTDNEMDE